MKKTTQQGKIIKQFGVNVWPHEQTTAEALVAVGYTVEFVRRSEEKRSTSADVLINGEVWEMKAPTSDSAAAIEKNVRKALHQSKWVIFDSRRMGRAVSDITVERELRKCAASLHSLRRLLFVNRAGEVVDIK